MRDSHSRSCPLDRRGGSGGTPNADAIYNELTTNLVSNARMVPAGIVAVNRAQERGYSLASA
jgi:hypothetical protein